VNTRVPENERDERSLAMLSRDPRWPVGGDSLKCVEVAVVMMSMKLC